MMHRKLHATALAVVLASLLVSPCLLRAAVFVRGDVNADGSMNITDPTALLEFLFQGGAEPPCLAAADVNASGDLDLSDGVYLLLFLFASGPSPEAPYPECGDRDLGVSCREFTPCEPVDGTITLFEGGTLADLRALSPQLSFDHLVIEGRLDLPVGSSARLNVDELTVTPQGSIHRSRGPCDYRPGPQLFIRARQVVIEGEIQLTGVSGTRTTDTADCNSCTGTAGGRIDIVADHIELGAAIDVSGGTGSTSVSTAVGSCSFGCGGGSGGDVRLESDVLDLSGVDIAAVAGRGGSGSCQGEPRVGADGAAGSVKLLAPDVLMNGGRVETDGGLTLRADRTEIYGVLEGTLVDTIGGAPDEEPPTVQILSPSAGDEVSLSEPLRIRVRLSDSGAGVRSLDVSGLGWSGTVAVGGVENGVFTLPPTQALPPTRLEVTAHDNAGFSTTRSVDGLALVGDLTLPAGQSLTLSGGLLLPSDSSVEISGDVLLRNGVDHAIEAGFFHLTRTGRIFLEDETDAPAGKAPSLSIELTADATIDGVIDLSGRRGTPTTNQEQGGEEGGDLTCVARRIRVTGALRANGGDAVTREVFENQFGRVRIAAPGGDGGALRLVADEDVILAGTIAFEGGTSVNTGFGGCFDGGLGGRLFVSYGRVADYTDGVFETEGGTQGGPFSYSCGEPLLGAPGRLTLQYTGSAAEPEVPFVEIEEREPNATRINAQGVAFGAGTIVWGHASLSDDAGNKELTVRTKGRDDQVEDFYIIRQEEIGPVFIALDPLEDHLDLDLLLYDYQTREFIAPRPEDIQPGGATEVISGTLLPGVYLLAVSWWDAGPGSGSDYALVLIGE